MQKRGIRYYSTNLRSEEVSFREALLKGLAPDKGLYMPRDIPKIPLRELAELRGKNYPDIATDILGRLLNDEVGKDVLSEICRDIYRFEVPIEKVTDANYVLRLDRGPTASFKDFAALFMGRIIQYFLNIENQHITILTATSGDTGGAVANAFYNLDNIRVIILFPLKEVTEMQRKQMTTLKRNIKVLALDGKFDDCQRLVKQAFADASLSSIRLSSANSINIGRLLPQSVYYFYAWSHISGKVDKKIVFSVPSGNFGNLTAGLFAREMGLPVRQFVISTNENNEVPVFMGTGVYNKISPSINCISSAMNVGHPSNLARIIAMYGGVMDETGEILKQPDIRKMRDDLSAVSVTDLQTRETIAESYRKLRLLLEPHGAVAWQGLMEYLKDSAEDEHQEVLYVSLETAHPAKFGEEIYSILNFRPPLPDTLARIAARDEDYTVIENDYNIFRSYIYRNS